MRVYPVKQKEIIENWEERKLNVSMQEIEVEMKFT